MRTRTLALALAATLCVGAPAAAAAGFKGKTDRGSTVVFKYSGGKVRSFQATVYLTCVGGGSHFDAVIPPKAMKVKGGKFSYKGRDKADGSDIEINGKVKGRKASGRVEMRNTTYNSSTKLFQPCTSGTVKWKAKR